MGDHPAQGLTRLNAPYGARCFLTGTARHCEAPRAHGLNAPYGARCFLTEGAFAEIVRRNVRLNAPYGARCFLTRRPPRTGSGGDKS